MLRPDDVGSVKRDDPTRARPQQNPQLRINAASANADNLEPDGSRTMIDPHSLPFVCLLWKAAPNLLLGLGGSAQSPILQLGKDDLIAVKASLMSLVPDRRLISRAAQATAIATGGVSPSSQSCSSASERQASSMRL